MNLTNKEINLTDKALKEAGLIHAGDFTTAGISYTTYIVAKSALGSNKVLQFLEITGLVDLENPDVMKSDTFYKVELTIEAYAAIGKQITKTIA